MRRRATNPKLRTIADADGYFDDQSPAYVTMVEQWADERERRTRPRETPPPPAPQIPAAGPRPARLPFRPPAGGLAPSASRTQPRRQITPEQWKAVWGPPLWAELHEWGRQETVLPTSPENRAARLNQITRRVPCGECKQHWVKLLRTMPPPLAGTGDELYAWTVAAHNAVNRRLGKPVWGLVKVTPPPPPAP